MKDILIFKTYLIQKEPPQGDTSILNYFQLLGKLGAGLSHNIPKVHFLPFSGIQRCILKRRLFLNMAYIYCLKTNFQFRDSSFLDNILRYILNVITLFPRGLCTHRYHCFALRALLGFYSYLSLKRYFSEFFLSYLFINPDIV